MGSTENPGSGAQGGPYNPPPPAPLSALDDERELRRAEAEERRQQIEEIKKLIKDTDEGNKATRMVEWLQLGANAILAVVGISACFIYGCQLSVMGSQLGEMKGSGGQMTTQLCLYENQLIQMQRQAIETHNLAETTRDSLVEVQRAVISATGLETSRNRDASNLPITKFFLTLRLKNSGNTATKNMAIHVSWAPMVGIPKGFKYPDIWTAGRPHKAVPVYASAQQIVDAQSIEVDAATMRSVQDKSIKLYIWGWARYRDVFEGTPEHISRFCSELSGYRGDPFSTNSNDPVFPVLSNCEGFNCHDEECTGQKKPSRFVEPLPAAEPKPCPKPN